jgi:hypothetical protein
MSIFQSKTKLSWPLALTANAGREPPFIRTIGEAAHFAEDEIRLGLVDDALWRQCFAALAAAYDSPSSQLLVTQATRATQLALYGYRLLEDIPADKSGQDPMLHNEPTYSAALPDRVATRGPVLVHAWS